MQFLVEKPIVTQLVEKFSIFYGIRRFIALLTTACHCSLSWTRCVQSTSSRSISLRSILILSYLIFSRDSSVGTALGYGLDDRGSRVDSRRELGIFLFTTASRTALGPTQPPVQWVSGALSVGVKRPGREADHSPPYSTEVKECVELYLHSRNTPSWRGA
jgi:hypothetical protein